MITIFFAGGDQETLIGEARVGKEYVLPTGLRVIDYAGSGAITHSNGTGGSFTLFLEEGDRDTVDKSKGVGYFGNIWPNDVDSIIFSQSAVIS